MAEAGRYVWNERQRPLDVIVAPDLGVAGWAGLNRWLSELATKLLALLREALEMEVIAWPFRQTCAISYQGSCTSSNGSSIPKSRSFILIP
jgi:hypothetical protein